MNNEAIRTCPCCAETIKVKAKLCPHCRQWLSFRSFRHPLINMLVLGMPMLTVWIMVGAAFLTKFERIQNPKPSYSEFPDSIKVLESRMNWAQTHDGLRIFITGIVTNQSPVEWKDIEFDCRFFDANGVLIDASNGYGHFKISGNDNLAFRVSVAPTVPTNDYASFKVSVSTARNGKSWF